MYAWMSTECEILWIACHWKCNKYDYVTQSNIVNFILLKQTDKRSSIKKNVIDCVTHHASERIKDVVYIT